MAETPKTAADWFVFPDVYATTLITLFLDMNEGETQTLEWHPETIRRQIETELRVTPPSANFDKLMGAIAVVTTDAFYGDLPRFIVICQSLVGNGVSADLTDLPDTKETAWAITEGMMLSPPEKEDPFSDEIRAYIAAILKNEGFSRPPDVLRLALGGGDMTAKVSANLAHDPDLYKTVMNRQAAMSKDVQDMIARNLQELVSQLGSLDLRHGDAKNFLKRLPEHLKH